MVFQPGVENKGWRSLVCQEAAFPSEWKLPGGSKVNGMVSLGGALQSKAYIDFRLLVLTCSVM